MFEKFERRYSLSKTLRFRLIPQGDTLERMNEKGYITEDQERAIRYKRAKDIFKEQHRLFIEKSLHFLYLEGLEEYAELFEIKNRSTEEELRFFNVQESLRKQIIGSMTSRKEFSELFKKEILETILKEQKLSSEDQEIIESFFKFYTIFSGFNDNMKNMYSDEEKTTAIAYRTITENLPKHMLNMRLYERAIENLPDDELKELEAYAKEVFPEVELKEIFEVRFYNEILNQTNVNKYNQVIGEINKVVNLLNQKNSKDKRIGKFLVLYKQILGKSDTESGVIEKIESDQELLDAVLESYEEVKGKLWGKTENILELFKNLPIYDLKRIYVRNDGSITNISNGIYGEWNEINKRMYKWYDDEKIGRQRNEEKYKEARKRYFKNKKYFSVDFLNKITREENAGEVEEYFQKEVNKKINEIKDYYKQCEEILNLPYNVDNKLQKDSRNIRLIKNLLDSIKELQWAIKPLYVKTTEESDIDDNFYSEYSGYYDALTLANKTYNQVRNYLTQKPYSLEKIKLYMSAPTILSGFDANKEKDNLSVILRKQERYYLAIMDTKHKKFFEELKEEHNGDNYEKMEYKLLPGPNKMFPKVVFAKSNKDLFNPSDSLIKKYNQGTHKKGKAFNLKDCHELIDFFKRATEIYSGWKIYDFKFSDTKTYKDISEFYKEVSDQGYKISFRNVSKKSIDQAVEQGYIYLFQIYNKDFSDYSKGKKNLHTMYWEALFDEKNRKEQVYKLNGGAEMFYREASLQKKDTTIHKANEEIKNKNLDNNKKTSVFEYDIIKDKRFVEDQFQFHVPITINYQEPKMVKDFNEDVREAIRDTEHVNIIGIDRGERHLLYISVINEKGEILEQHTLNSIINISGKAKKQKYITDYHNLLNEREKERAKARESWQEIKNIKELKEGYLSQVVTKVVDLMLKYNAIICMEDLNFGFKRGRMKIERSVYQKFETALISKLNYVIKKDRGVQEQAGLYHALQLSRPQDTQKRLGKQTGFIFYLPAWMTSQIDPSTGFINQLYPNYKNVEESKTFYNKFKDIYWDKKEACFIFDLDYKDFHDTPYGIKTDWRISSHGTRVKTKRDPRQNNNWMTKEVEITKELQRLFEKHNIKYESNLKEEIVNKENKDFFEELTSLFKLILQLRNSTEDEDYILSPVKNTERIYFDSRLFAQNNDSKWPCDGDANGAYNIAKKGLWAVQQIKKAKRGDNINLALTHAEWIEFAQQ